MQNMSLQQKNLKGKINFRGGGGPVEPPLWLHHCKSRMDLKNGKLLSGRQFTTFNTTLFPGHCCETQKHGQQCPAVLNKDKVRRVQLARSSLISDETSPSPQQL